MKYSKILSLAMAFGLLFSTNSFASENKLEDIEVVRGKTNHYYEAMTSYPGALDAEDAKKIGIGKMIRVDESNILQGLDGKKFVFMSGAGAWQTEIFFNSDGTFSGEYSDSDGSERYVCQMKGKFVVDSKVNETCYILRLVDPEITSPSGTNESKNFDNANVTVKYVDSFYGFATNNDGDFKFQDKFTLYTPMRQFEEMSQELKSWLGPSYGMETSYGESYQYIIVNNSTIEPFVESKDYTDY
ncbi:MAG: hypothetical protein SOW41_08375 [Anaerococcus sp.]|nr:hypothetical protein [Peptoniphilaceae bacterium]MDY3056052.1 hypothetical protein [Anaerococcus sp.]